MFKILYMISFDNKALVLALVFSRRVTHLNVENLTEMCMLVMK